MCMSRSFTYICQKTEQRRPLCLKKSLTSHRMQLQWINFALASDSECLLVPWWLKIDLTGRLMAPAALAQQSSVYNRAAEGLLAFVWLFILMQWYLNTKGDTQDTCQVSETLMQQNRGSQSSVYLLQQRKHVFTELAYIQHESFNSAWSKLQIRTPVICCCLPAFSCAFLTLTALGWALRFFRCASIRTT